MSDLYYADRLVVGLKDNQTYSERLISQLLSNQVYADRLVFNFSSYDFNFYYKFGRVMNIQEKVHSYLGKATTFNRFRKWKDVSLTENSSETLPDESIDDIDQFIECRNYAFINFSIFPVTKNKQYTVKVHHLDTEDFKMYTTTIFTNVNGKQRKKIRTDSMPVAITLHNVTELEGGSLSDLIRINFSLSNSFF